MIRPTIQINSHGDMVAEIQRIVGVEDDGDFGPITQAAVVKWQRQHGLTDDGIVGPYTAAAMNEGAATETPSSLPPDQFHINPVVADTSHWNTVASDGFFRARRAGLVGVINKATQGTSWRDATYSLRRAVAQDNGLEWGAYHFGTAAKVAPQVDRFMVTANPDERTRMCLDFERNELAPSDSMELPAAVEFMERISEKIGRRAMLYGGGHLKGQLGGKPNASIAKYPLWLAQYARTYTLPPGFRSVALWQYTGDGRGPVPHGIDGITIAGGAGIDLNSYAGTEAALRQEWPGPPL